MSHLKVWFFCASVLSPSLAFSGHSSMDLLNRYCRLFQEDSWSRLRLVDAQNMVREKSVRDTVERVLHLGAASIRTEPKVQVEGSSRLGREHIAEFLVHFFPFELAESHQTLRGDLTQSSKKVVEQHRKLCRMVRIQGSSQLDTELFLEVMDTLATLQDLSARFSSIFRRYVDQDRVLMTGTMIDEYLEIEKRYLEIQGKNDIASFDFARGFLSQLHGLERAIRRLSGEDGYERLRERRVEMLAQLSQKIIESYRV